MRANFGWLMFGLSLTATPGSAANPPYQNPPVVVPGNGSDYDPHAKALAEIRDELVEHRKLLKAIYAQTGGPAAKPGADRKAAREQYMLRACAGCHTPSRFEDGRDGGLLLFNDDESKTLNRGLKADEWAQIKDQVQTGKMPKKPRTPATADERKLFD